MAILNKISVGFINKKIIKLDIVNFSNHTNFIMSWHIWLQAASILALLLNFQTNSPFSPGESKTLFEWECPIDGFF